MDIFEELRSKLKDTQLSENEIGVYITLLKIGESTTGKILQEYKMSAGKIYIVLDKLIKKGLVSYIIKNNVKSFKAQDPQNIIDFLEKEKQKIEKKEEDINGLLPNIIKEISKPQNEISVDIYEGNEGIKAAAFKFFDEHEHGATEYQFDNLEYGPKIPPYLKYLMISYGKKMIKKKVKLKLLLSTNHPQRINEAKEVVKGTDSEVRYIKGQKFASILFAKNRVLMFDYTKPSVVYIRNKAIAEGFIKMFESLWPLGKEI